MTSAARSLIQRAERAGLRPEVRPAYRGSVDVVLSGVGPDSGFGRIRIGARSGRVIALVLRWDNDDQRTTAAVTHTGFVAAATALDTYREMKGW